MNPQRYQEAPLLGHTQALTLYLEGLFREAADDPAEEESTAELKPAPVASATAGILASSIPIQPVTCALVKVGELRLAMPLIHLCGVRRPSGQLCRVPEQPRWSLGITTGGSDGQIQVVDTAKLLGRAHAPTHYFDLHIVIVAPERWGLACDGVEKLVRVAASDVRWRAQRDNDPWFAGVVSGELCSFIDVPALVTWLDAGAGHF